MAEWNGSMERLRMNGDVRLETRHLLGNEYGVKV